MTTLTSTDFAPATTASDKGMYKAQDDLGTSYYFRGAVDNNWIKYGKYIKDMYNCNNGTISNTDTRNSCTKIASSGDDIYWRIIRINGDGSIRMIYSGVTPPTESTKVIKTTDTSLGNSPFNQKYNSAEYVGYMYEIGKQHGTSQSSDIKTYLDNWYANYTDLNKTGTKITDQIYCNDRTASTTDVAYSTTNYTTLTSWNSTGTNYYYGANGRVWNNPVSPDYKCPVASDKFTTTTAKGNGKLSYPVGLISVDEITFAGLPAGRANNSFYLYTRDYYWAGSPYDFFGSSSIEFRVGGGGDLGSNDVYYVRGVRPVVSLSSKVKLSGNGTYNDVYVVS
ncbi:unknown [Mycoplasma sp. CAG:472]|nr:unknown [Mycoplasma sp. CAG:472]